MVVRQLEDGALHTLSAAVLVQLDADRRRRAELHHCHVRPVYAVDVQVIHQWRHHRQHLREVLTFDTPGIVENECDVHVFSTTLQLCQRYHDIGMEKLGKIIQLG